MFFDEMERIDRGMSIDHPFARQSRRTAAEGGWKSSWDSWRGRDGNASCEQCGRRISANRLRCLNCQAAKVRAELAVRGVFESHEDLKLRITGEK